MEQKQSMMLIDTDVLINLFDPLKSNHAFADKALADLINSDVNLYVSVITEIELLQGSKSISTKNKLVKQLKFFQNFSVIQPISIAAKNLIITYSATHGLLLGDSLIAATALHFDIPLFSFNKKDFRFIKNLKLYEP